MFFLLCFSELIFGESNEIDQDIVDQSSDEIVKSIYESIELNTRERLNIIIVSLKFEVHCPHLEEILFFQPPADANTESTIVVPSNVRVDEMKKLLKASKKEDKKRYKADQLGLKR